VKKRTSRAIEEQTVIDFGQRANVIRHHEAAAVVESTVMPNTSEAAGTWS
jgi:hypothetical protein